jgi:hypothetical protein
MSLHIILIPSQPGFAILSLMLHAEKQQYQFYCSLFDIKDKIAKPGWLGIKIMCSDISTWELLLQ